MNTITFSDYEASTTGRSVINPNGYNVEIKQEGMEWSAWAIATMRPNGLWKLSFIRISGNEDDYPALQQLSRFFAFLDSSLDGIMNKLIPSHQNANNG